MQVIDTFAKDCFVGPDPLHPDTEAPVRFCVGDEHYVSTLLAVRIQGIFSDTVPLNQKQILDKCIEYM